MEDRTKYEIAVIIPARYDSEELFCRSLADIAGKPMIQHVYERVREAKGVDLILVATDHEKITNAVEG